MDGKVVMRILFDQGNRWAHTLSRPAEDERRQRIELGRNGSSRNDCMYPAWMPDGDSTARMAIRLRAIRPKAFGQLIFRPQAF